MCETSAQAKLVAKAAEDDGVMTAADLQEYKRLKAKGKEGTITEEETERFIALKKKKKEQAGRVSQLNSPRIRNPEP